MRLIIALLALLFVFNLAAADKKGYSVETTVVIKTALEEMKGSGSAFLYEKTSGEYSWYSFIKGKIIALARFTKENKDSLELEFLIINNKENLGEKDPYIFTIPAKEIKFGKKTDIEVPLADGKLKMSVLAKKEK